MGVTLTRHLGPVETMEAAQYVVVPPNVVIKCPCCNELSVLKDHTVDGSGVVTPRYACPIGHCPFLEYLLLESFSESP